MTLSGCCPGIYDVILSFFQLKGSGDEFARLAHLAEVDVGEGRAVAPTDADKKEMRDIKAAAKMTVDRYFFLHCRNFTRLITSLLSISSI